MIKTDKDLDDIVKEIIEGKKIKVPTKIESPGPASYQTTKKVT